MKKLIVLLIVILAGGISRADYGFIPPDREFVLLLNSNQLRVVDSKSQECLVMNIGTNRLTIPFSHFFLTHYIYSDAICCGDERGPSTKRIEEVIGQLVRGKAAVFLVQVSAYVPAPEGRFKTGNLHVSYIRDFDPERDYKRYCIDNEYYDRIHFRKMSSSSAAAFEESVRQCMNEDVPELIPLYTRIQSQQRKLLKTPKRKPARVRRTELYYLYGAAGFLALTAGLTTYKIVSK